MQVGFGVGQLALTPTPLSDAVNAVQVGVLKDVTLEFAFEQKELYGAYQFPLDVTRARGKVTGKAKFAQIGSNTIAALFNQTASTGMKVGFAATSATTPSGGPPPAITVAPPNSGVWYEDLGVIDTVTGLPLTRVASAGSPANATQYEVAAGLYQFFTGFANPVLINYSYTLSSTGKTVALQNQLMGAAPTFKLDLFQNFKSKDWGVRLPAVIIPKLDFALKQDDYSEVGLEFQAFADSTLKVADWYSTE